MGPRAARALYVGLFGLGLVLYVVFVFPRWWVLTGDIPRTLATAGRIATGIPIALAALPVMQLLQTGLRTTPRPPELALRLRAWSGLLHAVAGVLILLAAIAEIWLRLQVGAPWLFGFYGAAGAIAVLGLLALYLSFVADKAPAAPKPPKAKKPEAQKDSSQAKKPTTKRGKTTKLVDAEGAEVSLTDSTDDTAAVTDTETATETETKTETETETETETAETVTALTVAESDTATESEVITAAESGAVADTTPVADQPAGGALRNKRPTGKSRRRVRG